VPYEQVVGQLQNLGMPGYEAKTYIALIAAARPINGYEVAKRSGVPRGTVYETLDKLVARGAAFEVRGEDGSVMYVALPPDQLIARYKREFEASLGNLHDGFKSMRNPQVSTLAHHVSGAQAVLARACDLIEQARQELYLSIWPEEEALLESAIAAAEVRGVDVWVVSFSEHPSKHGQTYAHLFSSPDVVLSRVGCRLLVVVADRKSVLIGGAVARDMWGMCTEDPAVVLTAVEFVRHDIAMQVLVDKIGRDVVRNFWDTDETLVRLVQGRGAPALDRQQVATD